MPNIKLQSSDEEIFEIDEEIAKCSSTIKFMLENIKCGENDVIPLPKVDSYILGKVIAWAEHHKDDPQPEDDENSESHNDDNNISPWDADFLDVDQSSLYGLILASYYLDIKGLIAVTQKTLANIIKDRSKEDLRKLFKIKNDLDSDEFKKWDEETYSEAVRRSVEDFMGLYRTNRDCNDSDDEEEQKDEDTEEEKEDQNNEEEEEEDQNNEEEEEEEEVNPKNIELEGNDDDNDDSNDGYNNDDDDYSLSFSEDEDFDDEDGMDYSSDSSF